MLKSNLRAESLPLNAFVGGNTIYVNDIFHGVFRSKYTNSDVLYNTTQNKSLLQI